MAANPLLLCVLTLYMMFVLTNHAVVTHAAYVFNSTELELAGEKLWGPDSNFYRSFRRHHKLDYKQDPSSSISRRRLLLTPEKHDTMVSSADSSHLTVGFYNIFEGGEYKTIVDEQLHMINETRLYGYLDKVFYNTVGPGKLESSFNIEGDDKYVHLYHFEDQGDEVYTLGMMYRFCRAYPRAHALYFHDKGSYHASAANTRLRHLFSCHVLNPQCVHALRSGEVDTCGMRASPIPHPHYPGNFFWSTCSYMNTLIDPWGPQINSTLHEFDEQLKLGDRERYFAESWIGSGADIRPGDCIDATVDTSYLFGYYFPGAFDRNCPNPLDGKFGWGKCKLTSTWTNGSLFTDAYLRICPTCPFTSEIQKRSMFWNGQPARSYELWIASMTAKLRSDLNLKNNSLVRSTAGATIYLYRVDDDCLHAFPNWNTFVRMGFDTDQVKSIVPAQAAVLNYCEFLPPL